VDPRGDLNTEAKGKILLFLPKIEPVQSSQTLDHGFPKFYRLRPPPHTVS
jgi:hypothetical protein